jgi:hypothetical protein
MPFRTAVSFEIVRPRTVRFTSTRLPSRTSARTTRGWIRSPPLATELMAATICSGVTPT